jgi:hypothetical protein
MSYTLESGSAHLDGDGSRRMYWIAMEHSLVVKEVEESRIRHRVDSNASARPSATAAVSTLASKTVETKSKPAEPKSAPAAVRFCIYISMFRVAMAIVDLYF